MLGTLRLPAILLLSGDASWRGDEHRDQCRVSGLGRLPPCPEGRVDRRIVAWMTPPSILGAVVGALLTDELPTKLLLRRDRGDPGLERRRPARTARPSAGVGRAEVDPCRRVRVPDRRAGRSGRRDPRNAAHAGAPPRCRPDGEAGSRDEPRDRLRARHRRLRDACASRQRRLADPRRGHRGCASRRLVRRPSDRPARGGAVYAGPSASHFLRSRWRFLPRWSSASSGLARGENERADRTRGPPEPLRDTSCSAAARPCARRDSARPRRVRRTGPRSSADAVKSRSRVHRRVSRGCTERSADPELVRPVRATRTKTGPRRRGSCVAQPEQGTVEKTAITSLRCQT